MQHLFLDGVTSMHPGQSWLFLLLPFVAVIIVGKTWQAVARYIAHRKEQKQLAQSVEGQEEIN